MSTPKLRDKFCGCISKDITVIIKTKHSFFGLNQNTMK